MALNVCGNFEFVGLSSNIPRIKKMGITYQMNFFLKSTNNNQFYTCLHYILYINHYNIFINFMLLKSHSQYVTFHIWSQFLSMKITKIVMWLLSLLAFLPEYWYVGRGDKGIIRVKPEIFYDFLQSYNSLQVKTKISYLLSNK